MVSEVADLRFFVTMAKSGPPEKFDFTRPAEWPMWRRLVIGRIVIGISDKGVSENLQLEPELSLEKAIQITCQS
jgi:hypothetical protein